MYSSNLSRVGKDGVEMALSNGILVKKKAIIFHELRFATNPSITCVEKGATECAGLR